jgi:type I restriction-modification system DNA methylase subunit
LSEKTFFNAGITTSVFIFEAGVPHNNKDIFGCYIENDGLETVKNQGRHDVKNKWLSIEDYWIDIIHKQSGNDTIQWINPKKHLSYQMPKKPFELYEEDFNKTILDYMLFENGIDSKELDENILSKVLYSSEITEIKEGISINISGGEDE